MNDLERDRHEWAEVVAPRIVGQREGGDLLIFSGLLRGLAHVYVYNAFLRRLHGPVGLISLITRYRWDDYQGEQSALSEVLSGATMGKSWAEVAEEMWRWDLAY